MHILHATVYVNVMLLYRVITRATYGGTESRFTDGSVVVFFFFMSSFCNWLRAHAIFSDRIYPQSNFFCQPGVVALAGSLSCYRKSNILNYLIGNVAGKYLVKYNLSVMSLASIVVLYTLTMLPTAHSDRGKPTLKI